MGNLPLTAVDIVVAVVLLASAGFAFLRGFVHEVLAIAAWAGAAGAALYGFKPLQPFFRSQIGTAWIADAACAASLFLVTLLILSIVTKKVSDSVRRSALNSVDSSLGFVFGLARGALLLSLAYMLVMWVVPENQPEWLAQSKSKPWLERGATWLKGLAPDDFGLAEHKTREASGEARQVMEAEETFRRIVAPQPAAQQPAEDKRGAKQPQYDKEGRSQLERLIQSNQQ